MKTLLHLILTMLLYFIAANAEAATKPPGIIYYNDPLCGLYGGGCPKTIMYNRYRTKAIAVYAPNTRNNCNSAAINVWRMGNPKNGVGFTNEDWQDLEVAKQKTGGWYRWGCCYSSDPTGTICLN